MRQFLSLDTTVAVLAAVAFAFCVLAPGARAQGFESRQADMLERTGVLLDRVEGTILGELKAEENELEAQAANIVSSATGDAEREARIRAKDRAMRDKARDLSAKIESWATGGEQLIQSLSADELNLVMSEARSIARYFGLDVEELGKLYELGKATIRKNEFLLPDALPPDKDESYARYFADFFTFAHNREEELNKYRKEQQEYRVTLFKRVTLAYIRALLAATEPMPPCGNAIPSRIVQIKNKRLRSFGCKDPVVENLRSYVQAVQKIASADADRFTAEANVVLAQQELTTDLAAGLPLVGDAMDFYNLYAGEDLAGRCLTRLDYGLTAIFAAVPFLPSGWATQAVKRMGLEESLSRVVLFMSQSSFYSEEMLVGLFKRFGIEKSHWEAFKEGLWMAQLAMSEISVLPELPKGNQWIEAAAKKYGLPEKELMEAWEGLNTEIGDLLFSGGSSYDDVLVAADGVVSNQAAKSLSKPLDSDAALQRNIKQATEDQRFLKNLDPAYRLRAKKMARLRLDQNLYNIRANKMALAGDFTEVKKLSNIVQDHADTLSAIAKEKKRVIGMRYVNEFSTPKIEQGFATKPMPVKPKSADWGPQAAFLPIDQKFSKLGNPKNIKPEKIIEFDLIVEKCLKEGPCQKSGLTFPNGDTVMVWKKGPNAEVPVIQRGDKFIDHDTGKFLDIDPKDTYPLEVVALPHPDTGELIPVTADYDMLIVGGKGDYKAPKWDDAEGYVSAVESETKDLANRAFQEKNGYKGGNLIHHGPEAQYTGSPGAFADDPLVTMFDPDIGGPVTIPRCDHTCMEQWCKTTKQCGNMPICNAGLPTTPCMQVDADRLLKDYLHSKRLDGYTELSPNSAWRWGEYNGLGGWMPKVVLDNWKSIKDADWVFGQYMMELGIKKIKRQGTNILSMFKTRAVKQTMLDAVDMLFSCPGKPAQGGAQ